MQMAWIVTAATEAVGCTGCFGFHFNLQFLDARVWISLAQALQQGFQRNAGRRFLQEHLLQLHALEVVGVVGGPPSNDAVDVGAPRRRTFARRAASIGYRRD
jgi:hypothetical protein